MVSFPINTADSSFLAVLSSISIQMSRDLAQGVWRIKSQKSQSLRDICNVWCSVSDIQLPEGPEQPSWGNEPSKFISLQSLTDSVSPSQLLTRNHQSQPAARGYTAIVSRGNQSSVELLIYSPWKWTLLSICSRGHSPKSPENLPHWQSDPLQPDLKRLFLQAAHPSHLSGHVHLLLP